VSGSGWTGYEPAPQPDDPPESPGDYIATRGDVPPDDPPVGGAPVREPRRPRPGPFFGAVALDLPTD